MPSPRSVLIIGLGDLGLRIALRLSADALPLRLHLAARDCARMRSRAALVAGCASGASARFLPLDALDGDSVRAAIETAAPDALVQCASMHSPWLLHGRSDAAAQRLRAAGFACELSAQLPIAHSVFAAAHAVGHRGLSINCSYPDVVNPVLAAAGLAPDIGIGNAGMVHRLAEAAIRGARAAKGGMSGVASPVRLHTLAHHAHVTMTATAAFAQTDEPVRPGAQPLFFVDGMARSAREVFGVPGAVALGSHILLNELTAAHAVDILRAYFGWSSPLSTAAPGVHGRAGGWPVQVDGDGIHIDLPPGVEEGEIAAFNAAAARLDGVEAIDAEGVVHFTDPLRKTLGGSLRALGDPLALADAPLRYAQLRAALSVTDEAAPS